MSWVRILVPANDFFHLKYLFRFLYLCSNNQVRGGDTADIKLEIFQNSTVCDHGAFVQNFTATHGRYTKGSW